MNVDWNKFEGLNKYDRYSRNMLGVRSKFNINELFLNQLFIVLISRVSSHIREEGQ